MGGPSSVLVEWNTALLVVPGAIAWGEEGEGDVADSMSCVHRIVWKVDGMLWC